MQWALVFYSVATMFVVVYSVQEQCEINDVFGKIKAYCGRKSVDYIFDFIPPISQQITFIDLSRQPLKQLPYNAFRNVSSQRSVSEILLKLCQISHVDAGALLNLHKLTGINLSHNDISHIDGKLFSHTKQLGYIHMGFNKIEVLPSGLFQNLTRLEAVYLQHNRIRHLERFTFRNSPTLSDIELYGNQIEFMDILFMDKIDNLTTLLLDGNPWKCDCELGPLYELLTKINQLDQPELVCETPLTLQGREWRDINRDKFVCPLEDAISTQDSVMTSTEPMTTTELDDNKPVVVYNGTRYQPGDTGIAQSSSNHNWIPYTISVLVLVCVVAVIIAVVLLKRRLFRRSNARNMDSDLSMRII